MRTLVLACLTVVVASQQSTAQDTCRVFSIPNPHGAAMTISRVFLSDTTHFTVEPLRAVPFDIGASETWDARVCIKARDGQTYSTTIRYQTTHGQASYAVTMTAPGTAGAHDDRPSSRLLVAPVPSRDRVRVSGELVGRADVTMRLYARDGALAATFQFGDWRTAAELDVAGIPNGVYTLVAFVNAVVLARTSIVIAE